MAPLVILLIAFGLILGFFTKNQALRRLGRVLAVASFTPILIDAGGNYFFRLSLEQKLILAALVSVAGVLVVLRILVGKSMFSRVMGKAVHDGIKAVFLFPFKMIVKLLQTYK